MRSPFHHGAKAASCTIVALIACGGEAPPEREPSRAPCQTVETGHPREIDVMLLGGTDAGSAEPLRLRSGGQDEITLGIRRALGTDHHDVDLELGPVTTGAASPRIRITIPGSFSWDSSMPVSCAPNCQPIVRATRDGHNTGDLVVEIPLPQAIGTGSVVIHARVDIDVAECHGR